MTYKDACRDLALSKESFKITQYHIDIMRIATFVNLEQLLVDKEGSDFVFDYDKFQFHIGNIAFTASLISAVNDIDIRKIDNSHFKIINMENKLPKEWELYFTNSLVLIHDIRNCIRHHDFEIGYHHLTIMNSKYNYLNGKRIPIWMLDFVDSYTLPSNQHEFFYKGLKVLMEDINKNTNKFRIYLGDNTFEGTIEKKIKVYSIEKYKEVVLKMQTKIFTTPVLFPYRRLYSAELLDIENFKTSKKKYEDNMQEIYSVNDSTSYINLYLMYLLIGLQKQPDLHYENLDLSIIDMIETSSEAKRKTEQVLGYYKDILLPEMQEKMDNATLKKHLIYIISAYNNIQKHMHLYNKEKIRVISNSIFHNQTYLNGDYVVFKDSTKKQNSHPFVSVEKENLEELCNSFENLYQEDCSLRTMFDNLYVMFRDADESEKMEDRERNAMEKTLSLSRYFESVYANYTGKKLDYNESFKNQFEGLMPASKKSKK